MDQIVAWFRRQRPDWSADNIKYALNAAEAEGLGTLTECAAVLRDLAEGRYGRTASPRRLVDVATRPWWDEVARRHADAAAAQRRTSPRCSRSGHEREPAARCALCAGEAKGAQGEPTGAMDPAALERARRLRSRRVAAAVAALEAS